ncbi:hypothetical protein E2C01_101455 [Portunus trituberculatus]|uniref:Uncharacterized protein n=1 Tax=Portunus trituberculatus TaxID=210409 RepID=A0A5B7KG55_PORTR|nr:hypothetical protein [Portunus trituberculatus]
MTCDISVTDASAGRNVAVTGVTSREGVAPVVAPFCGHGASRGNGAGGVYPSRFVTPPPHPSPVTPGERHIIILTLR